MRKAGGSPETDPAAELARIIDCLRRAIRLKNLAVATEETYGCVSENLAGSGLSGCP